MHGVRTSWDSCDNPCFPVSWRGYQPRDQFFHRKNRKKLLQTRANQRGSEVHGRDERANDNNACKWGWIANGNRGLDVRRRALFLVRKLRYHWLRGLYSRQILGITTAGCSLSSLDDLRIVCGLQCP